MKTTIEEHLTSPEITLDAHIRRCQIKLARSLESRRSIYLDTNFWGEICDANMGKPPSLFASEILHLLRELVANGEAFCPISDSTFAEVLKHGADAYRTRRATVEIIDELSLGVALIPFEMRVGTELAHFIHSHSGSTELYPLDALVWTKLSYVLGYVHPDDPRFDEATVLAIQKAFFDHLWIMPFAEIGNQHGEQMPLDKGRFERLAARLNSGNAEHFNELRSFQHTYAIEIAGAVDAYADLAVEIVNEMAFKATGASMRRGDRKWLAYEQQWKNLLVAAFKKDTTKNVLRSIHIYSSLHAYVRWNKDQKLEANDFFDFRHAAAAVGYCDAFFTETTLRDMVTTKATSLP